MEIRIGIIEILAIATFATDVGAITGDGTAFVVGISPWHGALIGGAGSLAFVVALVTAMVLAERLVDLP